MVGPGARILKPDIIGANLVFFDFYSFASDHMLDCAGHRLVNKGKKLLVFKVQVVMEGGRARLCRGLGRRGPDHFRPEHCFSGKTDLNLADRKATMLGLCQGGTAGGREATLMKEILHAGARSSQQSKTIGSDGFFTVQGQSSIMQRVMLQNT